MWSKISSAQIFWFCNCNVTTFPTCRKCKNFNFSLYTFPAEMLYLQKYLTIIFKSFLLAERWWKAAIVFENFTIAQIFWFCNSNATNFPISRKCKNFYFFPLHFPSRNAMSSKVFNQFSKTFFFGWKMRTVATMWLKISRAQIFWFCNRNVTTFPTSRKCQNFNFSLHTVPAGMLYLQKYLTNFQNLFFGWKMRTVAIVVENFKCTDILVLQ